MSVLVGYFPSWKVYSAPAYEPSQIPLEKLTHINYAFGRLEADGTVSFTDPWADIQREFPGDQPDQPVKGCIHQLTTSLKLRNANIKIIFSVGGWTGSTFFSPVAANPVLRQRFVYTAGELLIKYNLDGLDIDWEFPVSGGPEGNPHSPEDAQNFDFLLYELRVHLNHLSSTRLNSKYLELTIASSAAAPIYRRLNWRELVQYVDFINLMTYDYVGSWTRHIGHHSALYQPIVCTPDTIYSDATVRDFISLGVPPCKLVLGIPCYGRGFTGVPSPDLGQLHSGPAKSTLTKDDAFTYDEIKAMISEDPRNWEVIHDGPSASSCVYNRNRQIWISSEDVWSVRQRVDYIKRMGLLGAMTWELSQDRHGELLGVMSLGILGR